MRRIARALATPLALSMSLGIALVAPVTAATVTAATAATGTSYDASTVRARSPLAPARAVEARRKKATRRQIALATPGDFTGYGFDQCQAPTQAAMNQWWFNSPFTAVGIYISGDSRACREQTNLSADWVAAQVARGWRLLPIALGPQASCLSRFPRYQDDFKISPDPKNGYAKAVAQGAAEADKNAADATAYGIGPGATLWYDLEAFDLGNTHCRESALSFTSGWVTRIKQHGYVAGFYSSASSGIKMLDDARTKRPGQFALPDRIWIARWDGIANTSTTYIPEDGWRPGGRMKQYRGGHNETWGGVTINIDSNFIDLGAGSVPTPDGTCPGVNLNYVKYPLLKPGKQARRNRIVQCHLAALGHYSGRLGPTHDAATVAAAAAWRASVGLKARSVWGKREWVALLAGPDRPVVKRGSTGLAVHRLQRALIAAGAGRFPVTGVVDAATEKALRTYQARVKLPVSGSATPRTWNKLAKGRF
jgi:peptidoglycan hydrolase-like protein with peptidoglycan-binding domain